MVLWVRGVKMARLVYVLMSFFVTVLGISDLRRCADPKCEVQISEAKVVVRYLASDARRVTAHIGDTVAVYSKDAGNDTSLWGVEVRGKRGYIPKKMIKETRVIHRDLPYTVPTEIGSPPEDFMLNNNEDHTSSVPHISNSFSVVDGTTIYGNTSDNELETQPIETIAVNTVQSVDIQSSKTIDATSISENKLDYPNSSMILSQPTTSTTPLYGVSADEISRETQTEKVIEDTKESTVNRGESENNMQELVSSDSNEIVDKSDENEEKHKINERDNIGREQPNAQRSKDEDAEDENDDDDDDGDEEDEGDEVDEESQGLGAGEIEGKDGEGKDKIEQENSREPQGIHEKSEDSVTESAVTNVGETNVSEQEVIQNSEENSVSIDSGQIKVETPSENVDTGHKEENVGDESMLFQNGESSTIPDGLNAPNESEMNMNFRQNNLNDYIKEADHLSDVKHADSDEKKYNTERTDPNESTFETPGGQDELIDISINLTQSPDTNASDLSMNAFSDSNTADTENVEVGGEETTVLNPFAILGKLNEMEKLEDVESGENQIYGSETASDKESLDIPVMEKNEMTEKMSTGNEFQVNGDQYSSTTEDSFHEALEVDDLGQTENEESASVDNDIQEYDSSMPINTPETSVEVQGTCAVDVVGCEPENEGISKQLSHSEEAEQGWLAPLFETANVIAGIFVPSTSRAMYKNNLDIFQTTQSFLIVTAITVLVFTLGYYYLEKQRRDGFLRAKINSLEKELMVTSQEKYSLKDELENTREKLSAVITSVDSGETSFILKDELEECQAARLELEEQVATLEKELEAATEAGLELNRMMSELLSAQHGSDTLMKSVEHLQKQLDSQQTTINTMTANLKAKNLENESLQSELKLASEHIENLEDQLAKVNEALTNLQKEKSEIEHDFQAKNRSIEQQLVEALESKSADSQRLCRELDALQDVLDETRKTLSAREGEVSVLRECLNHVECVSNGSGEPAISLEELLNVGHLRGTIDNVTKERDELLEKLQGEEDARKLLEDHMKIVSEEVSTLRTKYEEADRGKMEAQTRLEVLSNYFKEKETQLQKELGLQEAMYIQKEGDALSTIEQIKAFQEEIENYKAQNEILKKEILDQERSMKSQIAVLEKKAHENWVAARQAERRLEESKQESTQLRNRLTMSGRRLVGTIPGPDVGKPPERGTLDLEHNGEISSSPAHMGDTREMPASPLHFGLPGSPSLLPPPGGQPLPPGPFPGLPLFLPPGAPGMPFSLPPPPGGLFPDDLRPPPLGRMSSPPPEPRGSFSPFEHSPPMSPPNRPYRSPLHYEDSPSRYRHQSAPSSTTPSFSGPFSPGKWEERSDPPRSSFRPLHRDPSREPKGSTLSSGHSSESLDKGNRHSRV